MRTIIAHLELVGFYLWWTSSVKEIKCTQTRGDIRNIEHICFILAFFDNNQYLYVTLVLLNMDRVALLEKNMLVILSIELIFNYKLFLCIFQ